MNLPVFRSNEVAGAKAYFSQERSLFPSEEKLAHIGFLALTGNLVAGEPCPLVAFMSCSKHASSPANYNCAQNPASFIYAALI